MDPSERRAARLRRRRERSRERRAAESSEQREARLAIRRETDRARRQQRLASESAEEREARLVPVSVLVTDSESVSSPSINWNENFGRWLGLIHYRSTYLAELQHYRSVYKCICTLHPLFPQ